MRVIPKFGIKIDKLGPGAVWYFGVCLVNFAEATYLEINLFKIAIKIGRLYMLPKEDANESSD